MAHNKVYAYCENFCLEETLTKEQIEKKFYEVLSNGTNINNIKTVGHNFYAVMNASGTLPSGYSSSDNNFFIDNLIWGSQGAEYGRQLLYDVRTLKTYERRINNGVWDDDWTKRPLVSSGTGNPSGGSDGDIYFKY